ncbi:MAG: tetratricopeptide repeat protein [Rhodospirillaceae bacterium]
MADKIPDPQQEALFREVDEDLREEQMARLWKQYGGYLIAAAVLIVVIVAGYQGWTAYRASQEASEAQAYENAAQAVAQGNAADAASRLADLAASGTTGHAALARLRQAGVLLEQGQTDAALDAYRALAEDGAADAVLRDVGRLLYALHGVDRVDPGAVQAMLAPLAVPNNAFRFSAREVQALLALRQGDTEQARSLFTDLAADAQAPRGVRSRAQDMLGMLGGAPAPKAAG